MEVAVQTIGVVVVLVINSVVVDVMKVVEVDTTVGCIDMYVEETIVEVTLVVVGSSELDELVEELEDVVKEAASLVVVVIESGEFEEDETDEEDKTDEEDSILVTAD